MRRYYITTRDWWWFFLLLFLVLFDSGDVRSQEHGDDLVKTGQYIFSLAGGCACHTMPREAFNAGARAFPIPFGKVYSTNITHDKETGLGNWTDQQIRDAIVKGIRRDGSSIIPVMPYQAYSGMAEEDLQALIAYLKTLKPVKKPTPALQSRAPFTRSLGIPIYLKVFGRFSNAPAQAPKSGIERGRYLVEHVSLCGDCHTPRNFIGVPNRLLELAGAAANSSPLGQDIPNITPDKETGIGDWKREDIAKLLLTGTKPDFHKAQGLMAEVIQGAPHGLKDMRREDALAIADYLKSLRAIKNQIR